MYNKYNNTKTEINGIKFDSKKEASRYSDLVLMEKAGIIKDLQRQVSYELQEAYEIDGEKIRAIKYVADFVYFDNEAKKWVIEDVKPSKDYQTDVYKLKKKLFMYKYKIKIKEVY